MRLGIFRLLKPSWDVMFNQVLKPMHLCHMDDAEFVAISAIASWICGTAFIVCCVI